MLNRIVDLSLRYKLLVLLAFVLMAFFGVRAFLNVPVQGATMVRRFAASDHDGPALGLPGGRTR